MRDVDILASVPRIYFYPVEIHQFFFPMDFCRNRLKETPRLAPHYLALVVNVVVFFFFNEFLVSVKSQLMSQLLFRAPNTRKCYSYPWTVLWLRSAVMAVTVQTWLHCLSITTATVSVLATVYFKTTVSSELSGLRVCVRSQQLK